MVLIYSYSNSTFDSWDRSEGNYWSDYNEQTRTKMGIGDGPYIINENNIDHHPLMGTYYIFNFSSFYYPVYKFEEVEVISNSTIGNVDRWFADDVNSPTGADWLLYITVHNTGNGKDYQRDKKC